MSSSNKKPRLSRQSGTLKKSKAVKDLFNELFTTESYNCHETEAVLDEELIQHHSLSNNKVKLLGYTHGGLPPLSSLQEMVTLSTMSNYSVEDEPIQKPKESELASPTQLLSTYKVTNFADLSGDAMAENIWDAFSLSDISVPGEDDSAPGSNYSETTSQETYTDEYVEFNAEDSNPSSLQVTPKLTCEMHSTFDLANGILEESEARSEEEREQEEIDLLQGYTAIEVIEEESNEESSSEYDWTSDEQNNFDENINGQGVSTQSQFFCPKELNQLMWNKT